MRKQAATFLEDIAALGKGWPGNEQDGLQKLHFLLSGLLPELEYEDRFLIIAREQAGDNLDNIWQQAFHLAEWLEMWRTRLDDDADRMQAQEEGQPFFQRLIRLFTALDNGEEALSLSERARARAFVDLLARQDTKHISPAAAASANRIRAATTTLAGILQVVERRGSVTLEYFVHEECVYIWVIWPGGKIATFTSEISRVELTKQVEACLKLMRAPKPLLDQREQRLKMLEKLYACLIEPIPEQLLPARPEEVVTIIPHGPLFMVPFGALKKANGPYFMEMHAHVYAPSIAVLEYISRNRAREANIEQPTLLAFVNPSPLPTPLAPSDQAIPGEHAFAPLPFVEEYFYAITSFYPRAEENRVYAGENATKSRVQQEASNYTVLCFATHAQAFDTLPLQSYLALAVTALDSGYLSVLDVWNLDLHATLVILLACETAGGQITGDGVNGLSRAFLGAGASSLFLSFWPVPERESLDQLHLFHHYWIDQGHGRAEALRRAQIDNLRSHPEQPEFWAAFALFGEG